VRAEVEDGEAKIVRGEYGFMGAEKKACAAIWGVKPTDPTPGKDLEKKSDGVVGGVLRTG